MKQLSDLIYKTGIVEVAGATNRLVHKVSFDSRSVVHNTLFIAVRGLKVDGHDYIFDAVNKGATAIVCEDFPKKFNEDVTYVKVKDCSEALGYIASNFYENPSSKIKLVGVTGTNGKTTVATLLYRLFKGMNEKTGLLSTVVNYIDEEEVASTYTTPDALQLNGLLAQMVEMDCKYCFMEVSSHAIQQNRVAGIKFRGAVFTNLTHDHLDYHSSFEDYLRVKKRLFDQLGSDAFALSNKDDKNGEVMVQNTKAEKSMYSTRAMAEFKCKVLENQFTGLELNIDGNDVWTKLIGDFNAYNVLAVYAVALLLKKDQMKVLTVLSSIEPVEGRFDCFIAGLGITGIVDYAHTPDALENVLTAINKMRSGNENLITILGCGGDRDVEKRPVMAQIASEKSDRLIITSDNPRSEDPEKIIKEMERGVEPRYVSKVLSIVDRREAIKTACALATKDDIILVAGKGHEKYQEINGVRKPFDDKKELVKASAIIKGGG
ncbi:MAG TPA: UDP-N-acetylmuramoyl-L-alanyl-D-glutamate--2,6-diaminopimelate ligase [Flavobacteriales bacterium]|nr:UDP-N-acetylmuramoyl-L-alanyl-D-glutamate--2,6-diaminopimelate ligase [Flavobacteriales bacterium]HIN38959.1 UDP-N-acetylmuramoyl-L-alanyl-D-glutamate--2,6-diaminopimelate ligase [Flavobacteriales bacterium]